MALKHTFKYSHFSLNKDCGSGEGIISFNVTEYRKRKRMQNDDENNEGKERNNER